MEENKVVVKEKNSKGLVALVIILIIIILILSGYLVYDKFISKSPEQEVSDKIDNKENTKKVLLKDESKDIVYNYAGDDVYYGNKVPYININSKDAEKINQSILSFYNEYKTKNKEDYYYKNLNFNYDYYIDDEFVSIIVGHDDGISTWRPTKVYNINMYTGKEVTKKDILKYLNISDDEYTSKVVNAYKTVGLPGADDVLNSETDTAKKEELRKELEKIDSSNVEKLEKGDITGIYTIKKQIYVVFIMNTVAGGGKDYAILDVSNKKISFIK